ncbi:MAG TPA: hypothetical protein VF903_11445 [Nitrospirota bacterium]
MKKECAYVRRSLTRYLSGHLFKPQKIRIDRHLKSCVVCRSEYEALRQAEQTRLILKDIAPAEGILSRLRQWFSATSGLKKIAYRPLWIAGIVAAAAIIYHYAVTPRRIDVELERIEKSAPAGTVPAAAPRTAAPDKSEITAQAPAAEPFPISLGISQGQEKTAIGRINEVIQRQGKLANKIFSDETRSLSGTLTAGDLHVLLKRLAQRCQVSYNRRRFASFSKAQPVAFVLTLQSAPRPAASPASQARPAPRPVHTAQTPTAAPATEPTPSSAR